MYFRSTQKTLKFLQYFDEETQNSIDDLDAMRRIILVPNSHVTIVDTTWLNTGLTDAARIKFIRQSDVINGHLFFNNPKKLGELNDFAIIHSNCANPMQVFKDSPKLWFLDEAGKCRA